MIDNEVVESEQSPTVPAVNQIRGSVEIPNAAPVRLQTLDLARHIAIAPNGKRYVVAVYDDRRVGRGFIAAAYPQQNEYLTLIRLPVCEISSETPEESIQKYIELVQAIQQGKLSEFVKVHQK
jgi:hypothetical protein